MLIAFIGRLTGQADSPHSNVGDLLISFAEKAYKRGHLVMFDSETGMNFIKGTQFLRDHYSEVKTGSLDGVGMTAEVAVVMGGDGTMLNAAKVLAKYNIPLLGINLGRLGFITDVPSSFDQNRILEMLEKKEYNLEQRTMLQVGSVSALNDVVISRATGKILEFRVFFDEEYAYQARGDGLMISTPTGSTAYAMSAGGPIIHPTARIFEVIPMFPQTLSCRPLIINDTSNVTFELISGEAEVFVDGVSVNPIHPGDRVEISAATHRASFIHPHLIGSLNYSYYHTLREKLNWQHLPGTPR